MGGRQHSRRKSPRKANGSKSYAQAATQAAPNTIALPQLAPTAHTEGELDKWKPYEYLSDYEIEGSGYESVESIWGRRRQTTKTTTGAATGYQHARPSAQAVVIHGVSIQHKPDMMWRWILEDNTSIQVIEVRWLLSEQAMRESSLPASNIHEIDGRDSGYGEERETFSNREIRLE